jgi:hypothetical protein
LRPSDHKRVMALSKSASAFRADARWVLRLARACRRDRSRQRSLPGHLEDRSGRHFWPSTFAQSGTAATPPDPPGAVPGAVDPTARVVSSSWHGLRRWPVLTGAIGRLVLGVPAAFALAGTAQWCWRHWRLWWGDAGSRVARRADGPDRRTLTGVLPAISRSPQRRRAGCGDSGAWSNAVRSLSG